MRFEKKKKKKKAVEKGTKTKQSVIKG